MEMQELNARPRPIVLIAVLASMMLLGWISARGQTPVTDMYVDVINSRVELRWTTESEAGVRSFRIERSTDDFNWYWREVKNAVGQPRYTARYWYEEQHPGPKIVYYRIVIRYEDNTERTTRSIRVDRANGRYR